MLEKLRAEEPLTDKEKKIHDQGLVTLLKQIHDELDETVLEAYGWGDLRSRDIPVANKEAPHSCGAGESAADAPREALSSSAPLSPSRQECRDSLLPPAGREEFKDALLTRLVALNHERAAEEKRGLIRWLRPEYQSPYSQPQPEQNEIDLGPEAVSSLKTENLKLETQSWPTALSAQVAAIQKLLPATGPDAAALAGHFGKRTKPRIQQISEILDTLTALGKL